MTVRQAVGVAVALLVGASVAPVRGAAQLWTPAKCDLKPGHQLVNRGVNALKSATETRFQDQRQKDLKEAQNALMQAVTTGGQDKNPAAWYYLGRYYAILNDLTGTDTAFTKAAALAPQCQQDITGWRRAFWVPVFNEGVKAWQAGNTDSAIATFRRANAIYNGEPTGFIYLGTLFAGANQPDSAAKYFRLAVPAARDTQYAKDKRDALFNVARVYHAAQRWDDAARAYQEYLAAYPGDGQARAGLAAVYTQQDKREEAAALYREVLDHADSAAATDLFAAAQTILNAMPPEPDTAPAGGKCRADARAKNRTLTVRQIGMRCQAVTDSVIKEYRASLVPHYRRVVQAYEAGLAKNPYDRQALYNLSGVYYLLGDSAKVLPIAQRLYAVDPLNRTSLAKLAGGWQMQGSKDSALYYLTLADSLDLEVAVNDFNPDENGVKLAALVTNLRGAPSTPTALTFEFLDAKGGVVASTRQDVAAIEASGSSVFQIKATGAGIVAWRYRRNR